MSIVKVLDPHVADLIAAGEVVERPASVVKELLENSIDAGASQVTVQIKNGGIDLIQVTDNGSGMTRDDAVTCFTRHATSKISTEGDLRAILTLGFRGEALAAISSVSEIELITRTNADEVGTRVCVQAGAVTETGDIGCPVGTTIIIKKLFYNTPARMKFLKKNSTEANYCAAAVDKIALTHPEVAIRFIKDGRDSMRTPGDGKLYSAVYGVCGRDFANSLTEVGSIEPLSLGGPVMVVWGYVTKPELSLSSRNSQYFILNGRFIRSRTLGAAFEEAYRGSIMTGKYPGCVLHAAIDPSYVDVNVHPSKIEVKFADERAAFEAVYSAVKNALESSTRPSFKFPENVQFRTSEPEEAENNDNNRSDEPKTPNADSVSYSTVINSIQSITSEPVLRTNLTFYEKQPSYSELTYKSPDIYADDFKYDTESDKTNKSYIKETAADTIEFRIVGELFKSYIVVELQDEVMYIDKHAAHERVIYNELIAGDTVQGSQILLEPAVLPLSSEDSEILRDYEAELESSGIAVEDFGGGSVLIREIPPYIDAEQIPELIADICGRIRTGEANRIYDDIIHSISCKAAIKAGYKTGALELETLVRKVLKFPDLRYCPHGRPVALISSRRDFEKGFRRT